MRRLTALLLSFVAVLAAPVAARDVPADAASRDVPASPWAELDPWEPVNRKVYAFNRALDHAVLRPAARGYVNVVPRPLRLGIGNVFSNLQQPVVAVNLLLQGRAKQAGSATGRFLLNAVFGLGGIFDPATHAEIPRHEADFGQTFGRWGWQRSRFVMLPFFGPGTVRDALGRGLRTRISLIGELAEREGWGVNAVYAVQTRANALPAENFLRDAEDEYLLLRDVYYQRRECRIRDCSQDLPDYLLPDYEYELPAVEGR